MKRILVLLSAALLVIALLPACASPAPTPTAFLSPTVAPAPTLASPIAPPQLTASADPDPVEFVWQITGAPNGFVRPTGIAIDAQSNIYVVDGGNHRIQRFDSDGKFLDMWGSQGSADGQFVFRAQPAHFGAVAVDSRGKVYVTDYNARVQVFDSNGKFLTKWGSRGDDDGQFQSLTAIAIDPLGDVFISDADNYRIERFDTSGTFQMKWGSQGMGDGQFGKGSEDWGPGGLATDAQGNVYVADPANYRIEKFDRNGNFLTSWGSKGSGMGQFGRPQGVAVDRQGNVYVTDNSNHRVLQFDTQGKLLSQWGEAGTSPGMLFYPAGIASDNQGNLYIVNVIENVEKFRIH